MPASSVTRLKKKSIIARHLNYRIFERTFLSPPPFQPSIAHQFMTHPSLTIQIKIAFVLENKNEHFI